MAFDFEAKMLVHSYWQCLGASDGVASDSVAADGVAESIRWVAVVCATADGSAVMGLFAACHLIGWRVVLRAGVMVFSGISGGIGMVLFLLGLMLRVDQVARQPDLSPT